MCASVLCLKAVCATCNEGGECLWTAREEEGTEGTEGKAVGRKVWALTAVKMKAISRE